MSSLVEIAEDQSQRERLVSYFRADSAMARAAESIPPDMLLFDEKELEKIFTPTTVDYALKKRVWSKFYEVEKSGECKIKMVDLYDGICTNQYFYNELTKNPARVAWLLVPPMDTGALIEEAFRFAFQKVRNGILNMPVTEKTAPIILKTFQLLADRHLGPVIQRIESKNLNVEVDGNKQGGPESLDPIEIDLKLRELKAKLLPIKDVTPQDE